MDFLGLFLIIDSCNPYMCKFSSNMMLKLIFWALYTNKILIWYWYFNILFKPLFRAYKERPNSKIFSRVYQLPILRIYLSSTRWKTSFYDKYDIFSVCRRELRFYDHANIGVFDTLLNYYVLYLFICN